MSSNVLKFKQPIQMASSMKVPAMQLFTPKSQSPSKAATFKQSLYERAIGQHVYKSSSSHPDPCRYGDFESKGRCSDF